MLHQNILKLSSAMPFGSYILYLHTYLSLYYFILESNHSYCVLAIPQCDLVVL